MFTPQAERRVRLGLVVAELVRANNLQAKPEQLQAHIEELAQSYEKPAEVMRWYLQRPPAAWPRSRRVVIENNVTDFVLEQGQGDRQDGAVRRADGELSVRRGRHGPAERPVRRCRAPPCRPIIDPDMRSQRSNEDSA